VSDKPIFIRGVSRSGGTLLVTILDAHPDIAMSYELYPDLLYSEEKKGMLSKLRHMLIMKRLVKLFHRYDDIKIAAKKIRDRNLKTFFLRCMRGGLDIKVLARLLEKHLQEGMGYSDIQHCLKFVERCGTEKMNRQKKIRWGMKCTNSFHDYYKMWPNAFFINIIRDGRDVLSSQLNTGNFKRTPAETAKGWAATHMQFREFIENSDANAHEVFYERLVSNPDKELQKLCDFLQVPFNRAMLNFHEQDLTIFDRPAGHLSLNRISSPIDTSKIGRWKKDLNEKQLEEFYAVARDTMIRFGYLEKTYANKS
jgi:hypothetical protein